MGIDSKKPKRTIGIDNGDMFNKKRAQAAGEQPSNFGQSGLTASGIIGLSSTGSALVGNGGGDATLVEYFNLAVEASKDLPLKIKVSKIDKQKFKIGYSALVFSYVVNDTIYYYTAVLGGTGRENLTVKQTVTQNNAADLNNSLSASDVFTDRFFDKIEHGLKLVFNVDKFRCLDGLVMQASYDVEVAAPALTRHAHDLITGLTARARGIDDTLTISRLLKYAGKRSLHTSITFTSAMTNGNFGNNIKTDFILETSILGDVVSRGQDEISEVDHLVRTSGYVEYVMSDVANQFTQGLVRKAVPLMIINNIAYAGQTLEYALLGLITAAPLTQPHIRKALLIEADAGPLNHVFNFGGDPSKHGAKVSLKDPEAQAKGLVDGLINTHLNEEPLFAVEVELRGSDFGVMLPFAQLLGDRSAMANDVILTAAEKLCAPSDARLRELANAPGATEAAKLLQPPAFHTTQVFDVEPTYVPLGEYINADDQAIDLRNIGTKFIIENSNDKTLIVDWMISNKTPNECRALKGIDPYSLKLSVLDRLGAALGIEIRITGRAVRVVLSSKFVKELTDRATGAGFSPGKDEVFTATLDYDNFNMGSNGYSSSQIQPLDYGRTPVSQGGIYVQNLQTRGL